MTISRMLPALLATMTACTGIIDTGTDPGINGSDRDTEQGNDDSGGDVANSPVSPLAPGKAAIVFAHGLDGNAQSFAAPIKTALEAEGHAVLYAEVPGVESVQVRAAALGPQVDSFLTATGATKVHIIAHSMGGLDARYLISSMGYAPKVASLTT